MGDARPILSEIREDKVLQKLLLRALNRNQRLILRSIDGERYSLNALLEKLSKREGTSVSTLKLNARILREIGLIDYGSREKPRPVSLTKHGKIVLHIVGMSGKTFNNNFERDIVKAILRIKRDEDILLLSPNYDTEVSPEDPFPGVVKLSAGSDGDLMSITIGTALAKKMDGEGRVFLLMDEVEKSGSMYSNVLRAKAQNLHNIVMVMEKRKVTQGTVEKIRAAGWEIYHTDLKRLPEDLKSMKDVARPKFVVVGVR